MNQSKELKKRVKREKTDKRQGEREKKKIEKMCVEGVG